MGDKWQDFLDSSFGTRDADVLNVIVQEELTSFTFDGLKRRLGLHSETLSRILNRLEEEGLITRDLKGYRATNETKQTCASGKQERETESIPLLQTLLPPDMPTKCVVSELRGKWFGSLRWLGSSETDDVVVLKWITEDGELQMDTNFCAGRLSIEAKVLHGNDFNAALKAAHQLMGHIAKLYSRKPRALQVTWFEDCSPYLIQS